MKNYWYYNNKSITCLEDLPDCENLYGFVYRIQNKNTGKFYIGKKAIQHSFKRKISARDKKKLGTRKKYQYVLKESDWFNYWGSSKDLHDDLKLVGHDQYKRIIIELCYTKKYLSFAEIEWQIKEDVLRKETYNGNVMGKFYRRDLENKKRKE